MRFACLLLLSLATVGALRSTTPSPSEAEAGWIALARMDTATAIKNFTIATSRESRLGHALALLGGADKSPKNLTNSRSKFIALRDENSDDDAGIAATFYLARISQHFDPSPDTDAIISTYRELLSHHPGHPVAELAAPKLAILLLYTAASTEERSARFDEIEALLPTLKQAHNQRDTRLILADAILRLNHDHQRAYPLIKYCLDRNLILRSTRLNQYLLQAAESARSLDDRPDAIRHYERYIEVFPYDDKTDEIRRRLQQIKGEADDA